MRAARLKRMPEPATRSLTILETSTSPGPALAATRAATCTAMPPMSCANNSHSPVCSPARTSTPRLRAARQSPARTESRVRGRRRWQGSRRRWSSPRAPGTAPVLAARRRYGAPEGPSTCCRPSQRGVGRADDIGEQDRGQHPIGHRHRPHAGDEILDFRRDGVAPATQGNVVHAGQLDQFRIVDVLGQIAAVLDDDQPVAAAMQDERRDVDRREHGPDVGFLVHPEQRKPRRRARAGTQERPPHLLQLGIVLQAGRIPVEPGRPAPPASSSASIARHSCHGMPMG